MLKIPAQPARQLVGDQFVFTRNLVRLLSVLDTAQFDSFVRSRNSVVSRAKTSGSFGVASE